MNKLKRKFDKRLIDDALCITHGILHAGFRGLQAFVARKKGQCKMIGNRFVIPHDTIPSTLVPMQKNRLPHD